MSAKLLNHGKGLDQPFIEAAVISPVRLLVRLDRLDLFFKVLRKRPGIQVWQWGRIAAWYDLDVRIPETSRITFLSSRIFDL